MLRIQARRQEDSGTAHIDAAARGTNGSTGWQAILSIFFVLRLFSYFKFVLHGVEEAVHPPIFWVLMGFASDDLAPAQTAATQQLRR